MQRYIIKNDTRKHSESANLKTDHNRHLTVNSQHHSSHTWVVL